MSSENRHQEMPNVNKSELARIAGVSLRTVDGWTAAGLAPVVRGDGRGSETLFSPADVIRHLAGRSDDDATKARRRLTAARARMAEIELQRAAGEVVPLADMEGAWFAAGRLTRDRLLSIPSRIAAELAACQDPHEVSIRLEAELRLALEALTGPAPGTEGA
ncbi:MAG: Achromobacter phage Mano [Pseudomonadota bacterium]|jgi:phage terminase Nu1 subunit (DNA packaging protein)